MVEFNDEMCIMLVEQNPYLYDRKDKNYTDEALKENTWNAIGMKLDTDVELVKKRWQNLRDRFVRCHRSVTDQSLTESAAAAKAKSFPYYHSMIWLAPHLRKQKFTSSLGKFRYNSVQYDCKPIKKPPMTSIVDSDDSDLCFAKSLASDMRLLTPIDRVLFKQEAFALLHRFIQGNKND